MKGSIKIIVDSLSRLDKINNLDNNNNNKCNKEKPNDYSIK